MDINKRIVELENEIAILPQGSINIKKIKGQYLSGYCSLRECGHPPAVCQQKSDAAGQVGCLERAHFSYRGSGKHITGSTPLPPQSCSRITPNMLKEKLIKTTSCLKMTWGKH